MDRTVSPWLDISTGIGCDNMTVIVIALLNGRTVDEWYDWVAERVEKKVGYDTPRTYALSLADTYPELRAARWASSVSSQDSDSDSDSDD
jgi:hypothetical protein